jgi:hypothetical protein
MKISRHCRDRQEFIFQFYFPHHGIITTQFHLFGTQNLCHRTCWWVGTAWWWSDQCGGVQSHNTSIMYITDSSIHHHHSSYFVKSIIQSSVCGYFECFQSEQKLNSFSYFFVLYFCSCAPERKRSRNSGRFRMKSRTTVKRVEIYVKHRWWDERTRN